MKINQKQRELFKKTRELRDLNLHNVDYEKTVEIRKKEQELYDKWLFYKNLGKEIEREKDDECR